MLRYNFALIKQSHADVVKLVYTPDLGSGAARRGGSSPLIRTIKIDNPFNLPELRTFKDFKKTSKLFF